MKISNLIRELQDVQQEHGDIECLIEGKDGCYYESFFVLAEEYDEEDGGWAVNIRTWPY